MILEIPDSVIPDELLYVHTDSKSVCFGQWLHSLYSVIIGFGTCLATSLCLKTIAYSSTEFDATVIPTRFVLIRCRCIKFRYCVYSFSSIFMWIRIPYNKVFVESNDARRRVTVILSESLAGRFERSTS